VGLEIEELLDNLVVLVVEQVILLEVQEDLEIHRL
jgi:hypothetical protein